MKFYKLSDIKCPECGVDIIFGITTMSGGKTEDMMESAANPIEVDIMNSINSSESTEYINRKLQLYRHNVEYYIRKVLRDNLDINQVPAEFRKDVQQKITDMNLMTSDIEPDDTDDESDTTTSPMKVLKWFAMGIFITITLCVLIVSIIGTFFGSNSGINVGEDDLVVMLVDEVTEDTFELVKSAVSSGDSSYIIKDTFGTFEFIRATYNLPDGSILHARFYYSDVEGDWTLSEWYFELPARIGGEIG